MNNKTKDRPAGDAGTREKTVRPAAIYRKSLSRAVFDKRFIGRLELAADKEFLASCFESNGGTLSLRTGLDARSVARLNKLSKFIKANAGVVKSGPLVATVLLAGGLAVFGAFFMNPLLEKGAEAGLQAAFSARASVSGLRFRPLRMSLSIKGIAVADAAAPMTDLFRVGRIELRLNPSALLRGRFYIEEASASSISVGDARNESGALPGTPAMARQNSPKPETVPLIDFQDFDAAALLEREKSRLASTAAYREAGDAYAEAVTRWTAKAASSHSSVESATAASSAVLAIQPSSIKSLDQAVKAVADAKAAIGAVQATAVQAADLASDASKDAERLSALEKAAQAAVARDSAYLKAFVDPKSGAAMAALEPSLLAMLSDTARDYLYYGSRLLEAAGRLKSVAPASAPGGDRTKTAAPGGRDVRYPGASYPAFRLGLLSSSFSSGDRGWSVAIGELSSEPDLVPAPSSLNVAVSGAGGFLARLAATADFRSDSANAFSADGALSSVPLDLGDSLADVGLSGFTGSLSGSSTLSGGKDGSFNAVLSIAIDRPSVASPSGTLGRAISEALAEAGSVNASIRVGVSADGKESISLSTDMDTLVARAVASIADRYARKAAVELESALRAYIGGELEGSLGSKAGFEEALAAIKGDRAASAELRKALDAKLKSLEDRAKVLGASVIPGIGLPKIGP